MDERIRRLLARGRELYAGGELDRAERALTPLLRERLPFPDLYEMLGVIHYQRGKVGQAQEMFEEALRLNPGYTEAALNLAVTYNEQGRYEDARAVYKKMMAARKAAGPLSPTDALDPFVRGQIANMHAEVGAAYEEAGLWAQAIVEYEKALELCPQFVDIRMKLGVALRAAGNLAAAIRELERAKKEKPKLVAARLQLGMTLYVAKKPEDAAREWRQVLQMEPDNKFAKLYLRLVVDSTPRRPRP